MRRTVNLSFGIYPLPCDQPFEMNETSDYKELCLVLIERWRNENLKLNVGATELELTAFETCYNLRLPDDIRYFYSVVNGMYDWDMDHLSFSLWPLSRIQENTEGVIVTKDDSTVRVEITFGDYMIDGYRYMLVSKEMSNYQVWTQFNPSERVAENFTDFLRLYLSDPEKLYLL